VLRQAADPTEPTNHFWPRRRVLRYRVAAVQGEMLEMAALLKHTNNADHAE
jgi:hypothetical protein